MTTQAYRVYLSNTQSLDIHAATNEPLYLLIERLVEQNHLPTVDAHEQPIRYALYAGQLRRLSNEMSLRQAGHDQGGDLYLTNVFAPWWETSPALTRRLDENEMPAPAAQPATRRIPLALIGMIAAGVVIIGVVALLLTIGRTPEQATATGPTSQAVITPAFIPTATLVPPPTSAPLPTVNPVPGANVEPLSTKDAGATSGGVSVPLATTSTPTLILPTATPAVRLVTVSGVREEYRNRDERLFFGDKSNFGAFLWRSPDLSQKVPASKGNVVISNGDRVQVLGQSNGIYHIKVATNTLDAADQMVIGATGYLPGWLITNEAVPTPRPLPPTPTPDPRKLRMRVLNHDDQAGCISVRVVGISTAGWTFSADGTNIGGRFDNAGNARLCGLGADQEVTISIKGRNGRVIPGGGGVPSKGRAIMYGEWR